MSLKVAKAHNVALSLAGKKALIVGGTSGIGQAIALKLAGMKADVTVAGRSKEAGAAVVESLKKANPEGAHDFRKLDLSLMKEVQSFSKAFLEEQKALHYLVLCAGIMTTAGRTETPEGIDIKLAIHYYGRWLLIKSLMPLLEATEGSRVMSIFAAGLGKPVEDSDMDLKKNYTLKRAADAPSLYNDLMVQSFATLHPRVAFMHIAPGFIDTALGKRDTVPWYLRAATKMLSPFMTSPANCAEYMTSALTADDYKQGWFLLNRLGQRIPKLSYHTDELVDKVWKHTEQVTDAALTKEPAVAAKTEEKTS